ncbi:hypothetical protein A4X09_0g7165, partial [Tilletia walkeri]
STNLIKFKMSSSTRSQASLLQETLDAALARLEALEDSQRQTRQENQDLRQRLDARVEGQPRAFSPNPANVKEPKVASPETFHGRNKTKLAHFLLGLNIVLQTQASRFPDDKTKITYAISFLRDEAMSWIEPFANKEPIDQPDFMKDFRLFVKELKTIFGDPDEVATAERQIRSLRQRGAASAYFADFRRFAAVLDWNDSALASQAYTGLKDKIKDELARVGRPTTVNELITTATRIDTRIYERDIERERERPTPSSSSITIPNRPSSPPVTTIIKVKQEPKDFKSSSTRRGPLCNEEKDRRRREGLCLYCASKNHDVSVCPLPGNSTNRQIHVLLDPGASLNYIDPSLVQQFNLPTEELPQDFAVQYADGSSAKNRTSRTVTLTICCSEYCFPDVKFYVSPLTTHRMFFGIPWFLRFGISLDFLHLCLSFNVHAKPVEQANDEVNISDSDKRSIRATLASSSTGSLAPTTSPLQLSAHLSSPTLLQEQTNEEIHVFGTHFGTPTLTQTTPTSSNANFGIDLGTLPQPTLQPSVQPQSRSQVHSSSLLGSRLQEPSHSTVAESANHFGTDFGTPFQPNSTARQTCPTFTEEDEANQRHVPEAFHDFLDVFRKSSADKLPEHRHYDHKITLQPGTTPTFGPI